MCLNKKKLTEYILINIFSVCGTVVKSSIFMQMIIPILQHKQLTSPFTPIKQDLESLNMKQHNLRYLHKVSEYYLTGVRRSRQVLPRTDAAFSAFLCTALNNCLTEAQPNFHHALSLLCLLNCGMITQ